MFDVISIGDTTLDVFVNIKDASVNCDIKKHACQLCVGFGDKIPVDSVSEVYAVGSAPNVAVGLARLGFESALYSVLGDDDVGRKSVNLLLEEGVAVENIFFDKKNASDYSVVLLYNGERTILVHHKKRSYPTFSNIFAKWFFVGSIGQHDIPFYKKIISSLKKSKAKLAFNPGPVQIENADSIIKLILPHTEILFLNKQEAFFLSGTRSINGAINSLYKIGVKIVVITDGAYGAYVSDGSDRFYMPSIKKSPVDVTGCGDAFASGFLASHIQGFSLVESMEYGTVNALSVLSYIGAHKGLLNGVQIKAMVKKYKKTGLVYKRF